MYFFHLLSAWKRERAVAKNKCGEYSPHTRCFSVPILQTVPPTNMAPPPSLQLFLWQKLCSVTEMGNQLFSRPTRALELYKLNFKKKKNRKLSEGTLSQTTPSPPSPSPPKKDKTTRFFHSRSREYRRQNRSSPANLASSSHATLLLSSLPPFASAKTQKATSREGG